MAHMRCGGMADPRPLWLVENASSGSNDREALDLLEETCGDAGFHVAHRSHFPRYDLPGPAMLDAAGIDLVAVFAGDGTINAVLTRLAGWSGSVLVLPGGTMNLLYHRLHGGRDMQQVIRAVAAGRAGRVRPTAVRGPDRTAYAGLMAGPGTSWNRVREAMRANAILDMAGNMVDAIEQTLGGAGIACAEPELGRREGYPLILLTPRDDSIVVEAYHAEGARDYLVQSFALLKRDFRDGPHDELGRRERVVLASTDGSPFGLLVDGEPAGAPARAEFTLVRAEVDLLSSHAQD